MSPTFSADDVGKSVESENGKLFGMVAAVDGERAYVQPEPGLVGSIKAALRWEIGREDTAPIEGTDIDEITDAAIHLGAYRPLTTDAEADGEDAPPQGDRTVTEERGYGQDR
ncbi:hypothetical protein OB905_08470 [Halobacteria archaeon AArc-dxtr1]|nr:hypothetical protein [Halobacteria archaeon AArc-dxtr1]